MDTIETVYRVFDIKLRPTRKQEKQLHNLIVEATYFKDYVLAGNRYEESQARLEEIEVCIDGVIQKKESKLPGSIKQSIYYMLNNSGKGKKKKQGNGTNGVLGSDGKPIPCYETPLIPDNLSIYRPTCVPLTLYISNVYGIKRLISSDKYELRVPKEMEKVKEFGPTKGVFFVEKKEDKETKKVERFISPIFGWGSHTHSYNKQLQFFWVAGVTGPIRCKGLKRLPTKNVKRCQANLFYRNGKYYVRLMIEAPKEVFADGVGKVKKRLRGFNVGVDLGLGRDNQVTISDGLKLSVNIDEVQRVLDKKSKIQSLLDRGREKNGSKDS